MVYFASFQDVLGRDKYGNIKAKNQEIHAMNWDCVVFDEYHFGAWRDSAKSLFAKDEELHQKAIQSEYADMGINIEQFDENELPITADHYLYLSGTPFRAIASGEFIEEQIFNWTYGDEQKEKLKARATAMENFGNFFAQNTFIGAGGVLIIVGQMETLGYPVTNADIASKSLPIALICLILGIIKNIIDDKKMKGAK